MNKPLLIFVLAVLLHAMAIGINNIVYLKHKFIENKVIMLLAFWGYSNIISLKRHHWHFYFAKAKSN